jgi:hypothetical protein
MKTALISFAASICMMTACSAGTEPNDTSLAGQNDTHYPIDVNQNANWHSLNEGRLDLGDDQNKIRAMVDEMEGIEPGMVMIIGADAWVNATYSDGLSKEERKELHDKLETSLRKAVPRYHIHLDLD